MRAIDIWIGKEKNLGKGYGTIMMTMALERCFSEPKVTAVIIDPLASNLKAHRFYERIGFKFLENRRFGKDDCYVYQLTRIDWLTEQLIKCISILVFPLHFIRSEMARSVWEYTV